MKSSYKRYACACIAACLATGSVIANADSISNILTKNTKVLERDRYSINGTGVGQYKTITDFSDWTEDMKVAEGVANDDARIFRGSHEGPVYDTYALYSAWDDDNLYMMWQFVNVTDVVDPAQGYPISDNGKPWNGDIPQILAFSIDPNKSGNGEVKGTDSKTGETYYNDNIWGIRVNYETKVDTLMYFSSKPGVGQPAIFKADDDSYFSYDDCVGFKDAGVSFKYQDGFLGDTMMGIESNGWAGYKPEDLFSDSSNWVNMLEKNHNTNQDTMYSMTIPLESLGIDREYIENNGIGVMHISTFGQSGITSLPYDESMLDVATEPYGPDASTSAEKEDYDVVTAPLARIGKKDGGMVSPVDKLEINELNASKKSPQDVGTTIDLVTEAEGGKGSLSYKYEVDSEVIKDFSSSNKASWKPTEAGDYTIKVTVKDSKGTSVTKTMKYKINESKVDLEISEIEVSKEKGKVGVPVDITTIANGSGETYYTVSIHEITEGWKVLNKYSDDNTISWTPKKSGAHKIWVDVKDEDGNTTKKCIDYVVE